MERKNKMIIEEIYLKANFLVFPGLNPTLKSKNILKNEIIKKATEGIYYITTEEQANKIIEESLMDSPEPFFSYGLKKPVFYAGIPDFSVACIDLKLPKIITAIKINIPYETLALFEIETFSSAYKLFYPNFLVEPFELKKVYLAIALDDTKFYYKEISKEEKDNYHVKIPKVKVKSIEQHWGREIKRELTNIKKEKQKSKIK